MEDLKNKRKNIKAQLTRFKKILEGSQIEVQELKVRLEKAEELWNKFEDIQSALEALGEQEEIQRSNFEDLYFGLVAKARLQIQEKTKAEHDNTINANESFASSNTNAIKVKLPTLTLPIFTGKYSDWLMFNDSFKSIIDKNEDLTDIQKLQYLRGSLRHEALQIIQGLETTEENYKIAWDLLKNRYENEQLIVNTHLKVLFDLPQINKESCSNLRLSIDKIRTNISALRTLKEPVEQWNTVLIYLFNSKLDWRTRQQWQEKLSTEKRSEKPTLNKFLDFLANKCQSLEMSEKSVNQEISNKPPSTKKNVYVTATQQTNSCEHCGEQHYIFKCEGFLKLTPRQRQEVIRKQKLCINCFRTGHYGRDCRASSSCKKCRKRHNTLLHDDNPSKPEDKDDDSSREALNTTVINNCAHQHEEHYAVLPTALVLVKDKAGKVHKVRALLDSGSQSNFITKELTRSLGLKCTNLNISVYGINQKLSNISEGTQVTIKSRYNHYSTTLECLVLEKITSNLPQANLNRKDFSLPNDIELADDGFNMSSKIDLLIGSAVFWQILCERQIKIARNKPILQETQLGWVVAGSLNLCTQSTSKTAFVVTNDSLQKQLELFWKLEEINEKRQWTAEEKECEKQFENTVARNENGRFIVGLPKNNKIELGESYEGAKRRFESLEKRLAFQPDIKSQYIQFMQSYEAKGHMSKIKPEDNKNNETVFYLPHHHVIKTDSLTTKLRVVFDGSFQSSSGKSLNNQLLVGPVVQEDLFSIILRFRTHEYVITADIEMMFRQILVREEDRQLQRIIWRESVNQELQEFTLNTVTYGTACAPFLATRCLKELAMQNGDQFPRAKQALLKDFYMDDLLTGARTINEAIQLQQQLTSLLKQGAFELRKWRANNSTILSQLSEENNSNQLLILHEETSLKTLGVLWNSASDTINFNLKIDTNSKVTKRNILGQLAQIFDPLGLIGPITIKAKIIMQKLWELKVEWDDTIPEELHEEWIEYSQALPIINMLQIDRNVNPGNKENQVDIHGFCDASTIAYGACIYVTSTDEMGKQNTRLHCAKARVAPLKTISLPRLELCGATILARLISVVKESLTFKVRNIYLWSDSTIVLAWLKTSPNLLKTFTANRVAEVQARTAGAHWKHVNTLENPADVISRGETAEQLVNNKLWWQGPNWIRTDSWPEQTNIEELVPELTSNTMVVTYQRDYSILTRYSSWNKLLRIISYCLRALKNIKRRKEINQKFINKESNKEPDVIDTTELNDALIIIIRLTQEQTYHQEIQELKKRGIVSSKSKLLNLNPFLDEEGLIRVGGRLSNADISNDQKFPLLLPAKHHVTTLIIRHEHEKLLHCGQEQLLASVRTKFWPISGRQAVKAVIRKCKKCFRYKPKASDHIMGNLPSTRVKGFTRPFVISGLDYAGPIQIKPHNRRGRIQITRAYIAVFVCFSTKAVHLELVSNLTTEAFMAALRRFMARRGICKEIYSDNATNFVGANHRLKEINEFLQTSNKDISQELQNQGIQWRFIPPRAPQFGGLWEAAVKATKRHLYTVTQGMILTFEESATLLTEIEAILNSRPLIPLSASPNDLVPLTPAHFLVGDSLTEQATYGYIKIPDNKLTRWEHIQKVKQHFWKRWYKEYLQCLQVRSRWQHSSANIQPGTLVVIMEDNVPPLRWHMGRIIETFLGEDGVVRVVLVRTANGVYKRPVKRVCVLPSDNNYSS